MINKLYFYLISVLAAISVYFAHIKLAKRQAVQEYKSTLRKKQIDQQLEKAQQALVIEKNLNKLTEEQKREELESLIRDTSK